MHAADSPCASTLCPCRMHALYKYLYPITTGQTTSDTWSHVCEVVLPAAVQAPTVDACILQAGPLRGLMTRQMIECRDTYTLPEAVEWMRQIAGALVGALHTHCGPWSRMLRNNIALGSHCDNPTATLRLGYVHDRIVVWEFGGFRQQLEQGLCSRGATSSLMPWANTLGSCV